MRKCVSCDHELDSDGACPDCPKPQTQTAKLCEVCRQRMPKDANLCNACKSYQTKTRRGLVVAGTILAPFVPALSLLFSVLNLSSALGHDSKTHFHLLASQTSGLAIKISVWNSGDKPSWLLASRLVFEDANIAPVPLSLRQPAGEDCTLNLIMAAKPVIACLKADAVVFRHPGRDGAPYPRDEALALVRKHKVALQVDVEESNHPGLFRSHATLEQAFDESLVDSFLAVKP